LCMEKKERKIEKKEKNMCMREWKRVIEKEKEEKERRGVAKKIWEG
jgi:hypothetical protein